MLIANENNNHNLEDTKPSMLGGRTKTEKLTMVGGREARANQEAGRFEGE